MAAGRSIATLIFLRHTLRLMPPLVQALEVVAVRGYGGGGESKFVDRLCLLHFLFAAHLPAHTSG